MKSTTEIRFHLYAIFRNARLFDAFFILFLVYELQFSFTHVGLILAFEKIITGGLELPMAVVADRYGRRRCLAGSFSLVAAACLLFGIAPQNQHPLLLVLIGQTIYAAGESLRTGTHKAMVLQWLDARAEKHRRVALLGSMRFFSKTSGGFAALMGGIIVWRSGSFSPLFFISAIPAGVCAAMLLGYPATVEGRSERQAAPRPNQHTHWATLIQSAKQPGLWLLLAPSILFESQLKLAQVYLQPALATGAQHAGYGTMGGVGALLVGAYLCLSGVLAGSAALAAKHLSRRFKSAARAQVAIHGVSASVLGISAIAFSLDRIEFALVFLVGLAALQNARRPLFLAAVADEMVADHRTTILSLESQLRSGLYAVSSIGSGWLADQHGLGASFYFMAGIVGIAWLVSGRRASM
ncbi:MAG: MFS transporter [Myxococcota bacterium]|nr:MFS transporter [Myxococcota bacterium]